MSEHSHQELLAETLEFDLNHILEYALVTYDPLHRAKMSQDQENEFFPLIRRDVISLMTSPVEIEAKILEQYVGMGLQEESSDCDKLYSFSTLAIEIKPSTAMNPLLQIYSKTTQKSKRKLLMSLNLLDSELGSLVMTEIKFISSKLKKCGQHMFLKDLSITLKMIPTSQTLSLQLKYSHDLKVQLHRFFSSDVVTMLNTILQSNRSLIPIEPEKYKKFQNFPIDVHLFYKAMAENTRALPDPGASISHPFITSKLYPFQRKTVNWLLSREHVKFNALTESCETMPVVSEGVLKLMSLYPNCDHEQLNLAISQILMKLCFGWKSVLLEDHSLCWFNSYTGNIMSEKQMVRVLSDLRYKSDTSSLGGCGFLCEEMGLGKTVEIVSLILHHPRPEIEIGQTLSIRFNEESDMRVLKKAKTTLIAAPESIIQQWYSEIHLMCPHLLVMIYKGLNQYPELRNIPKYTAELLQRYDIVLMNYSVMAHELDFAIYSSQRASTREGRRRRGCEANEKQNEKHNPVDVSAFQAKFDTAFSSLEQEQVNFNRKRFDRANMEELSARARKEFPGFISHTVFYESPLMMCQWWRVVLDEVQMVAAGASRSFKTASMIPRIHSWGVSGTPTRLVSVLEYLKIAPFNYNTSSFCWQKLNNEEDNGDFIKLWLSVALRHTKAMVNNDINLPPQERILLSLPFTELEQVAYSELYASTLASIRLLKDNLPNNLKLSLSQCLHLRTWLLKLRQLCANSQIGKLNSSLTGKGKGRRKVLFTNQTPLKTLEAVLQDMLDSVSEEIWDTKKSIISESLTICQVLENSLYPQKVIEALTMLNTEISFHINKLGEIQSELQTKIRTQKKELASIDLKRAKELKDSENEVSTSEDDSEGENPKKRQKTSYDTELKNAIRNGADGNILTEEEKLYASKLNLHQQLTEKLTTIRIRLRLWKIVEHKCHFLLGSAHFQLYDPEYQKRIQEYRIRIAFMDEIVPLLSSYFFVSGRQPETFTETTETYIKDESLSPEEQKVAEHKHLETFFYMKAEASRNDILRQPLKNFNLILTKRLINAKTRKSNAMVNDGQKLFPKSSKYLLLNYPTYEVNDLENLASNFKTKDIIRQFLGIAEQLNRQTEFLNELVSSLMGLLSSPLLSLNEDPMGEEYAQSIDDQDKAATLMIVISQLIEDRSRVQSEGSARRTLIKRNQEDPFFSESQSITDQKYLKTLQKKRMNLMPKSEFTIEELLKDLKILELESSQRLYELEILESISNRIKTSTENDRIYQSILQKQLNTIFNPIFNSRVEYFKQLQQISGTVENTVYPLDVRTSDSEKVTAYLKTHLDNLTSINNRLFRLYARQNYLQSLFQSDNRQKQKQESQIEEEYQHDIICLICQGEIVVGSLAPCGHRYCKSCLHEWITRVPSCPMCKGYTDHHSIYNFTVYKADIKAEKVVNLHVTLESSSANVDKNQVYKNLQPATLKKIQNIKLSNSYGSKVDLIVKQVLYLRSVDPEVQIVIFSQWQDLLFILGYAFDQAQITHITARNSLSSGKRKMDGPAEQFKNKQNGITCFLLNAQIEASGLTLVNASHIFLCEPLVNTATELQAISRIHRIGQNKVTTVWMFSVQNTVEENIVALGTKKRLQYLLANARETDKLEGHVLGINGSSDTTQLKELDLLTAESEAMSYGTLEKRDYHHSENVEDKDISFVYFGEPRAIRDKEDSTTN